MSSEEVQMHLGETERKGEKNDDHVKVGAIRRRWFEEVCSLGGFTDLRDSEIEKGSRNNRVRNSRRCARGHCDYSNCCIQADNPVAVGRYLRQYKKIIANELTSSESGQSTVEFAVVTAGFLALTAALAALWRFFGDGVFVEHALAVASHHIQLVFPTTVADIFLY